MLGEIHSIKAYLLGWILGALAVSSLSIAIFSFYSSQHEVEELFDAELVNSAKFVNMSLSNHFMDNLSENKMMYMLPDNNKKSFHWYEDKILIQIYDEQLNQLFASKNAPHFKLNDIKEGFMHREIDGILWHLFALYNNESRQWVLTAQNEHVRAELVGLISMQLVIPFVIGAPFLLLITGYILNRGLKPLTRLANDIKSRNPEHLSPIRTELVPQEAISLVNSINHLMKKLSSALEREKQITSDAAHELKTPLATIKLHAQNASDSNNLEESKECLKYVINSVEKTTHLVDQLLLLARLDPLDSLPLETHKINFEDIITERCAEIYPLIDKKQLDLQIDVKKISCIKSHKPLLLGVINNLIDNAIKYTPEKGSVEIMLVKKNHGCALRISNDCQEISNEHKSRLFERFYRINPGDSRGSGLGLSIVKKSAQVLGATIELPEESGKFIIEVSFYCCRSSSA